MFLYYLSKQTITTFALTNKEIDCRFDKKLDWTTLNIESMIKSVRVYDGSGSPTDQGLIGTAY